MREVIPPTHVLTVTAGEDDDLDYELVCNAEQMGRSSDCQLYLTCTQKDFEHTDDLHEDPMGHGVEHSWIDYQWMVPAPGCWVLWADGENYCSHDLGLKPGTYTVHFDGSTTEDFCLYSPEPVR